MIRAASTAFSAVQAKPLNIDPVDIDPFMSACIATFAQNETLSFAERNQPGPAAVTLAAGRAKGAATMGAVFVKAGGR
jgi:hypothetical protein